MNGKARLSMDEYRLKWREIYNNALDRKEHLAGRPLTWAEKETFLSGYSAGFDACKELEKL